MGCDNSKWMSFFKRINRTSNHGKKLCLALSCPYLKPSQYLINKKLNMFISEFLALKNAVQISSHQSSYHISIG